jgi:serine/threonine protein phosphatase PrpC
MSLLSTDITKVKRLSLREVKLPTPELRVEPITPILVERPPSDERIAYSKLVVINPLLEELVERLDLVSETTGERIKKVKLREDIKPLPEPEIKAQEIDKPKLIALAQGVIKEAYSYSKDEVIDLIKKTTNVNRERAERGFNLMLQAGAIELTLGDSYYLTGSTPF